MTAIETERLRLRLPRLEDAEAILPLYSDPVAMEFIGGVHPELDPVAVVETWLERWDANGVGHFSVERRDDGRWLGRTGFVVWDARDWHIATRDEAGDHAQPELGWAFAREHWGHGYATEAARAVRDWAKIDGLISIVAPTNLRSQSVVRKLGCTRGAPIRLASGLDAEIWEHPR